jgi:hypothetical protein
MRIGGRGTDVVCEALAAEDVREESGRVLHAAFAGLLLHLRTIIIPSSEHTRVGAGGARDRRTIFFPCLSYTALIFCAVA